MTSTRLKIIQEETLQHKEAFEFYYSLGIDRSITRVAQKFNVTRSAIAKWSQVKK